MAIPTENTDQFDRRVSRSKLASLIRKYTLPIRNTVRGGLKTTQVHALNLTAATASGAVTPAKHHNQPTISSILSTPNDVVSASATEIPLSHGLPTADLLEPPIDPHLRPVDIVEALAELYRRREHCLNESLICLEKYSILRGLGDSKLLRRCLQAAREHSVDVHAKVVLSAWLRYERRENELVGISSSHCIGRVLECPKASLACGFDPNSVFDYCKCHNGQSEAGKTEIPTRDVGLISESDSDVCFSIGGEEIHCMREKIASLSHPLKSMLYGDFIESKRDRIDFSEVGMSAEGLKAVEVYSRIRRLDYFSPSIVLELLCFANRFCCEEMKSTCDEYLSSIVSSVEEALVLIDYGLEETANLMVASCLQIFLRELPGSLHNPKIREILCGSGARERLAAAGHCSFLLYYFLSQVAMEESLTSNITVMLLERLKDCAKEKWQKELAFHQLGCVLLEKKEYKKAQHCFEAAAELGHIYSEAGVARTKYKQGQRFSAYKMINSLISEHKPVGWMYQELALYNVGKKKKISDLNATTELDPTLSFPYKYRAVSMLEENQIGEAILEISKVIRFKVSSDCLELRAWFFIALEDFEAALRDFRALLTLDPDYVMVHGKTRGDILVQLLKHHVHEWGLGESWMQLYDRWSSVDDLGSLAVTHQMLANDPQNSLLLFRQSLLLLRLNCQKAAMRCLRLARNYATSDYERLIYEGWILYDTGYREAAVSKADLSISIQRSFEAFFLKAYALADATLDAESSSHVIQLLVEALRCPSDVLRKGQALNNLGSIYVDCGKLDLAKDCYVNALDIKHTRAHQGLARVYYLQNQRGAAYDEMTKLIEKARSNTSAYEKRSEYCDRDMANEDLCMATKLDPLRTYPYRYRAAVLMDDQRENEAVKELTKAIPFKPDLQMLHLRAAFHESMGDGASALRDCEAALCLDPNHKDTLDLYSRTHGQAPNMHT
ncbi:Ethylene-overproduction protein like [Actinidia chinensis var. chinensis]|uniref:Ethylene-overproduction protein like n=1 Tax=Actinidia chinensis var. chinensis TaxID=1590841 RepID=A0A2R6PPP3_ACTCC|nr:Ethylene-overproduction protein like [Actinidia chinensis var. chinensis]